MPVVRLPRPSTQYDPRPEVWELEDGTQFLSFYPFLVSSPLRWHGRSTQHNGYEFTTLNTVYLVDWAPTIRRVNIDAIRRLRRDVRRRGLHDG